MRQVYLCDICNTQYLTMAEAVDCEFLHPHKDSMTIHHISFASLNSKHGWDRSTRINVPDEIVIKFSDKFGDQARYSLQHYGPVGV